MYKSYVQSIYASLKVMKTDVDQFIPWKLTQILVIVNMPSTLETELLEDSKRPDRYSLWHLFRGCSLVWDV